MIKPIRMLDLIATLRGARSAMTAAQIAGHLGASVRTIYRDIAALQAMGVPIDGAAGLGYILRPGFHLPPLNFTADEAEAITVGLALLRRTGDRGLAAAATRVANKIAAAQPQRGPATAASLQSPLLASPWHGQPPAQIDPALLRRAIREERALTLGYCDACGRSSDRRVLPLALLYYVEVTILAAWCDWRQGFRHFRLDRITACQITQDSFRSHAAALRLEWSARHPHPWRTADTTP